MIETIKVIVFDYFEKNWYILWKNMTFLQLGCPFIANGFGNLIYIILAHFGTVILT